MGGADGSLPAQPLHLALAGGLHPVDALVGTNTDESATGERGSWLRSSSAHLPRHRPRPTVTRDIYDSTANPWIAAVSGAIESGLLPNSATAFVANIVAPYFFPFGGALASLSGGLGLSAIDTAAALATDAFYRCPTLLLASALAGGNATVRA